MENFGEEAPVHYWSLGYQLGQNWLYELWQNYLGEDEHEFSGCMLYLSFFSGRELADAFCEAMSEEQPVSVETMAESVVDGFESAMESYCAISTAVGRAHEPPTPETYFREVEKVGRNDPCPCGSGKKFKKCCLH